MEIKPLMEVDEKGHWYLLGCLEVKLCFVETDSKEKTNKQTKNLRYLCNISVNHLFGYFYRQIMSRNHR